MKQKDILLIAVIAIVSGVLAFIVSSIFIAAPSNLKTQIEVVEPISSEFKEPDRRYFNIDAINPTHLIRIEESKNQDPFN